MTTNANIIFESDLITEYDDGTEEVRFTADELAAHEADPVYYGYALPCGHSIEQLNPAEGCWACFTRGEALAEAAQYDDEPPLPQEEPTQAPAPDFTPDDAPF